MGHFHRVGGRADRLVSRTETPAASALEPRPWRRAICWLAFLAPFFYLTYGAANSLAARRQRCSLHRVRVGTPHSVSRLDHHSVLVDQRLLWSVALRLRNESRARYPWPAPAHRAGRGGRRASFCFRSSSRFSSRRPTACRLLFAALTSFDKPFNQAPSLHIALLVILWRLYAKHLPRLRAMAAAHLVRAGRRVGAHHLSASFLRHSDRGAARRLLHVAVAGARDKSRWQRRRSRPTADVWSLATRYLIGGGLIATLAVWIGGAGLWLLWPAVSLVLVAANYAVLGPEGFQKDADGRMSLAARLLLAPYLAGAFVNSRSWTRHEPKPVAIGDGVWLGRIPLAREATELRHRRRSVRRTAGRSHGAGRWMCIPMLDLVPPQPAQLRTRGGKHRARPLAGPVLVCCALGYSRSAAAVATWLLTSNPAERIERGHREGPSGAASHRHRCGAARRHRDRSGADAHDRADANLLVLCSRPARSRPNRRPAVAAAHRGGAHRHPGLSGADAGRRRGCWSGLAMLVALAGLRGGVLRDPRRL